MNSNYVLVDLQRQNMSGLDYEFEPLWFEQNYREDWAYPINKQAQQSQDRGCREAKLSYQKNGYEKEVIPEEGGGVAGREVT